jgi:hypothetical protein
MGERPPREPGRKFPPQQLPSPPSQGQTAGFESR